MQIKRHISSCKAPLKQQGRHRLRAQSIIEYSVVIACITAALVGMQIYVKRGIQGRLRQASDELGEQYAPTNTTADITTTLNSDITMNSELIPLTYPDNYPEEEKRGQLVKDGFGYQVYGTEVTSTIDETIQRSGSEKLGEFEEELFK